VASKLQTWNTLQELLADLQQYCVLPSSSSDHVGVAAAQKFLASRLESYIGLQCQFIDNPMGPNHSGPMLLASSKKSSGPRIAMISHADTLDGHEFDQHRFSIALTKDKIIGQGVLDDKASQFVALWGLKMFVEKHPNHRIGFDFVSSPNEELGSQGFHPFYEELSGSVSMALGFEPSLPDGAIVSERRGNRWYKIEVVGKEAHAGRGHKVGCNAAHELAIKIAKLHKLTNYKKDITLNIGQILSDSTTYNVVCGKAMAKLDLRFSDNKGRDEAHKSIEKILKKSHVKSNEGKVESQCHYTIEDDCPPLHQKRSSKKWVKKYLDCIESVEGKKTHDTKSGGGADVSYMARKDLVVIDGLGAIGGNMHRKDEYALIESIESRSKALCLFLEDCEKNLR